MAGVLPEELRRFILTSVPSVPFVEAMLLFRGAGRKPLTTGEIARRLYIGDAGAAEVIAQLQSSGIVQPAEVPATGHRYAPATPELTALLDTLAAFYATHLVQVTDMIHSTTARKATQFADAFRLRKDS